MGTVNTGHREAEGPPGRKWGYAAVAVVALIAVPFLIDHLRELRRPVLLEARVVTATESDQEPSAA